VRRRDLLALLGGTAVLRPIAGRAQQTALPVVGMLMIGTTEARGKQLEGFRQGLAEAGYSEGKNVAIEPRWAESDIARLPILAADFVARPVTVIAAISGPSALAAKATTTTIPIVFYNGFDPVELNLVASLAHPGGNLTGVAGFFGQLMPKRVELLRQLVPDATAFGFINNPKNPSAATQARDTREAARRFGIQIVAADATIEQELAPAFAALAGQVKALVLGADPLFGNRRNLVIALAAEHRLPTIYYDRQFAEAGGLVSYGDSLVEAWRQVGRYVGKVLKGATPADLPVAQPTKFELVVNLKTAKALGLLVPQSLLAGADEVIE
jgi:putative tryptophan/tyrosine transport system substrate-binding protein